MFFSCLGAGLFPASRCEAMLPDVSHPHCGCDDSVQNTSTTNTVESKPAPSVPRAHSGCDLPDVEGFALWGGVANRPIIETKAQSTLTITPNRPTKKKKDRPDNLTEGRTNMTSAALWKRMLCSEHRIANESAKATQLLTLKSLRS